MKPTTRICCLGLLASPPMAAAQQFLVSSPPALTIAVPTFDFFARAGSGDFDGDGDPDLSLMSFLAPRLLRNDGTGGFTDVSATLPTGLSGSFAATQLFFDIDGDGRDELLMSGYGGTVLLRFTAASTWIQLTTALPSGLLPTKYLAGDFDGDGDLDLAGAGSTLAGAQNIMLVNNGNRTFTAIAPFGGSSQSIAIGDFDNDGDLDIFFGGQARLLRNDGGMVFTDVTATQLPTAPGNAFGEFADVDNDGDLDLLTGDIAGNTMLLLRNTGAAVFVAVPGAVAPQAGANRSALFADVDGDGDLDLLRTGLNTPPLLARNDGTGLFVDDPGALPAPAASNSQLIGGDFDHDGDPDALWLPAPGSGRVLWNLHRQVVVPQPPSIGQNWSIELWSAPGYATAPRTAWLGLGLGRLPSPFELPPIGRLWLDLAVPNLLEAVPLPVSPFPTVRTFAVPNLPGIAGIELHAQALIEGPLGLSDARLTTLVSSVIQ
jgi:hypothetical protein